MQSQSQGARFLLGGGVYLPGYGDNGVHRWLGVPAYPSIGDLDGRGNALIHAYPHVKFTV
jgi:hypothetical protein